MLKKTEAVVSGLFGFSYLAEAACDLDHISDVYKLLTPPAHRYFSLETSHRISIKVEMIHQRSKKNPNTVNRFVYQNFCFFFFPLFFLLINCHMMTDQSIFSERETALQWNTAEMSVWYSTSPTNDPVWQVFFSEI